MEPFEGMDDYAGLINGIDVWYAKEAKQLSEILYELLQPKSVIDLGCASGIYLLPFKDHGCEVYGVEGDITGGSKLTANEYQRVDLRFPYEPKKTYDLAMCIETAEHLPAEYANTLVETLVGCSDTIFFTAADVDQGGQNHYNEQHIEYWLSKFAYHGYGIKRDVQPLLKDLAATPWIRRGILLEMV